LARLRANVAGGPAPYSFSLNNGPAQMSPEFLNIVPGSYTVVVTDGDNNMATSTIIVVDEPAVLVVVASVSGNTITATPGGGTSPYQYSIDGTNFQTSNVFNNVANGTVTITLRDLNGCETTTTATVNVNNLTASLEIIDPIRCNGELGILRAFATGGPTPYSYSLNNGPQQSSPDFTVPAGTYTVTVTDANNNSATSSQIVLTEPQALSATTSVSGSTISVLASGGQAPYEYSLDGTTFQTGTFFSGLAAGNYTATVRDATGATATSTFDILARPVPTVDVTVEGSRVTFSNFLPVTSGVEYSFDGGTTFSTSPVGYYYTTGSQNVQIRYGSCQFTQTVSITNPLVLTATDVVACADGTVNPSDVCASGGVAGFNVRTSAGTITSQATSNCPNGDSYIVFPPTGVSFIDVSVVDQVGATVVVTVPVVDAPAFTVGGTLDAQTLTVTVSGGTAPFTYSIDGGATTQNDPVFTGLDGTDYTVTVTDAFGCSVDQVFMISGTGDIAEEIGLQVFPNPMNDWLQIDVNANVQATGRFVLTKPSPRNLLLDVSQLTPGFYTLVVESPEGRAHVPVVRQ